MKALICSVALGAALVACGGEETSTRRVASLSTTPSAGTEETGRSATSAPSVPTDPNEAILKYARCMREQGIDMPDPQVNDGGRAVVAATGAVTGGAATDLKAMEAADAKCSHFMVGAAGSFTPPNPEEVEKMKEESLAFAKCMRKHGVDMPDPQFSGDGNVSIGLGGTGEAVAIDPTSKEFQDASKACGSIGGVFTVGQAPVTP